MKTIDHITRRLLGRHLASIDDVTGIPGRAPAIVITWSETSYQSEFFYDRVDEREIRLSHARETVAKFANTHDVVDNTL